MSLTPSQLGFRFPAEWAKHAATWVTWPHNPATWPHCFEEAKQDFAGLVAAISLDEVCNVIAGKELQTGIEEHLKTLETRLDHVKFWDWPTNDSWVRDYGPTFVLKRSADSVEVAVVDFTYNGWGAKYPPFDSDQKVATKIAQLLGLSRFQVPLTFEGGAIETDGKGRLLTTRFCAMNPNRNPGKNQQEVEQILKDYLGINQVWWLPGNPIEGDDTDGHIDQIARFTQSGAIVVATCEDSSLADYEKAEENLAALRQHVDNSDDKPAIITLPMPAPYEMGGQTLPASYTNFYITNHHILVPQFGDPNDAVAVDRLAQCFPNHKVKPLASRYLSDGLGSFHCLTQQQPAAQ